MRVLQQELHVNLDNKAKLSDEVQEFSNFQSDRIKEWNQKTKEIGVRKVLGASVGSIVILFTKEYIKLILIGFAVASPLAWFVMNKWLDNFAYKITIGPIIFLSGFAITLLIALATVGFKSMRAATVNPVNSLKAE